MEDYLDFISQIELFTDDGERLSDKISVPSSYQSTSADQLRDLSQQLYQTYVKQLEELEKSLHARNVLISEIDQIKREIDQSAGQTVFPEQLIYNNFKGSERLFDEEEARWE